MLFIFCIDRFANKNNKLGLNWAKLKFSSVRVINEITDILHSVEIKIKVAVELLISLDLGLGLGLITLMGLDTTTRAR